MFGEKIDYYDFASAVYELFQHCKTKEEIEKLEERMKLTIEGQSKLSKEYLKVGILGYKED